MAMFTTALEWLGFSSMKQVQDRSRFTFSPQLIDNLQGDHAELLELYAEMEKLALAGRYASVPPALHGFKTAFDLHILNENLHFYCYVEERLAQDPGRLAFIRGFRAEMNAIARTVVNFARKYNMAGVRPSNGDEFLAELRQVGAALSARIESEERDLYSLYLP